MSRSKGCNDDELRMVPEKALSLSDVDRAGVKDIHQITDYQVRHTDGLTQHTIRFGGASHFSITYSADRKIVGYEAIGVQFEKLGNEIFVSRSN